MGGERWDDRFVAWLTGLMRGNPAATVFWLSAVVLALVALVLGGPK